MDLVPLILIVAAAETNMSDPKERSEASQQLKHREGSKPDRDFLGFQDPNR